jgi:pyruvate kinase
MIDNPRPTRAEVSDVANAIYDGSDAVMLSGESAMGAYPVEAVKMMARIVAEAEGNIAAAKADGTGPVRPRHKTLSVAETICEATAHAAEDLELSGIAIFTETGATAIKLSKYQPAAPIYAFSSIDVTINRLNLLWGVVPVHCAKVQTTEAMVELAETLLEQHGYVHKGEIVAIVAGTGTKSGSTNFLRLHKLGDRIHRVVSVPTAATVGV